MPKFSSIHKRPLIPDKKTPKFAAKSIPIWKFEFFLRFSRTILNVLCSFIHFTCTKACWVLKTDFLNRQKPKWKKSQPKSSNCTWQSLKFSNFTHNLSTFEIGNSFTASSDVCEWIFEKIQAQNGGWIENSYRFCWFSQSLLPILTKSSQKKFFQHFSRQKSLKSV